jgi:hypothetical protein
VGGKFLTATPAVGGKFLTATPAVGGKFLTATPAVGGKFLTATPAVGEFLNHHPHAGVNSFIVCPPPILVVYETLLQRFKLFVCESKPDRRD